jgi:hypothetical protein
VLACLNQVEKNIVMHSHIPFEEERKLGMRLGMSCDGITKVLRLTSELTHMSARAQAKYSTEVMPTDTLLYGVRLDLKELNVLVTDSIRGFPVSCLSLTASVCYMAVSF